MFDMLHCDYNLIFSLQNVGFLHAEQFCQNLTMFPQLQSYTGHIKNNIRKSRTCVYLLNYQYDLNIYLIKC